MGDEVSVSALPLVVRLGGSCLSPLVSVLKKGKNIEVCQQNHLTTVKKVNFESDTKGCRLSDRQETSPKLRV